MINFNAIGSHQDPYYKNLHLQVRIRTDYQIFIRIIKQNIVFYSVLYLFLSEIYFVFFVFLRYPFFKPFLEFSAISTSSMKVVVELESEQR